MPKEKLLFWERLRQRIGFEKERTLFIDDNEDVLRSAREYGLRYILQKAQARIKDPSQSTRDFNSITDFSRLME